MIRENREYRNLGSLTVEEKPEAYEVTGYASTFDKYPLYEYEGRTFYERIEPTVFVGADMSDVVFLRDHEGRVLARTKNNSVELTTDEHGLKVRANLGLTSAAKEMYEDISVNNYSQMSFAFTVDSDYFDENTDTRVITRLKKIYDVSAVSFPANPFTDIGISARDYFHGVMEKEKAELLKRDQKEKERRRLLLKLKVEGVTNGH